MALRLLRLRLLRLPARPIQSLRGEFTSPYLSGQFIECLFEVRIEFVLPLAFVAFVISASLSLSVDNL